MNWEKETFRIEKSRTDMAVIPHWARAEQLERVMPLCRIWTLKENAVMEKHHLCAISVRIRLALAGFLRRMADAICPGTEKSTTTI